MNHISYYRKRFPSVWAADGRPIAPIYAGRFQLADIAEWSAEAYLDFTEVEQTSWLKLYLIAREVEPRR